VSTALSPRFYRGLFYIKRVGIPLALAMGMRASHTS
jgi:hypothetical protein